MALWLCGRCGCTFAVGLSYCPHCTSTDHQEVGEVAKTTRHGGASVEGGEQPSDGNSSSTSTEKQPRSSEPKKAGGQAPAPTTGRRSKRGRGESSTARSTGGSGRGTGE